MMIIKKNVYSFSSVISSVWICISNLMKSQFFLFVISFVRMPAEFVSKMYWNHSFCHNFCKNTSRICISNLLKSQFFLFVINLFFIKCGCIKKKKNLSNIDGAASKIFCTHTLCTFYHEFCIHNLLCACVSVIILIIF